MTESVMLALAAIGGGVGVLIGAFGIGGVLLAPALIYLLGVSPHAAITACMVAYAASGAVGTLGYLKRKSIHRAELIPLGLGAIPGGLLGALMLSSLPGLVVEGLLIALLLFAGWRSVRGAIVLADGSHDVARKARADPAWRLSALGVFTGVVSALTGTGGPVTLIPCLLLLGWAPLAAIGLSQVIQIPVSLAATTGNTIAGYIDWPMAIVLALALGAGSWAGVKFSHWLPGSVLRIALAVLTLACGIALSALLLARVVLD